MKRALSVLLALMMLLALCACMETAPEVDISGKYYATSCVIAGEEYPCDGEYVSLAADGTGTVMFMDDELTLTWTLKGTNFSFTDSDGDKFSGTYADGVLLGDYAGMDYVYDMNAGGAAKTKGGAAAVAAETDISGKYYATSCIINGADYPYDGEYVNLAADGTGTVMFMDRELTLTWTLDGTDFSFTDSEGDEFNGTYADGVLSGTYADMDYVYDMNAGGTAKGGAAAEPKTGAAPAGADFEPVSFEFDDGTVTVVGAEEFTDSDDEPAVRFYYDFTNTSDEPADAWWVLNASAYQAGFELVSTYASYDDDVAEYGNKSLEVYPGVTIRCIDEFSYNPEAGGTLTFKLDDYDDEFTVDFDAADLPGRPAEDLVMETISEPNLTEGYATEGEGDEYYLVIEDAEVVDGWDDAPVVRIYFTYTNNGDEASSCWWDITPRVFQDGVELETQWADEDVDEDDLFDEEIEPGESVYCSETWELRSDSPVELLIEDSWADLYLGAVFAVA